MRHPPIAPFATGHLPRPDGHTIYWECAGNPAGRPWLYLHGGPGGGCGAGARRYVDPASAFITLVDQRGCGRSAPRADAPDADLSDQRFPVLLADLEALRESLGIARWSLIGVSWGSMLALAYADAYPERVAAMVLALVSLPTPGDVRWIIEDMGRLFPEAWSSFDAAVPAHLRHLPRIEAWARATADPDPAVHRPAAAAWCAWEQAHVSLTGDPPDPRFTDPAFQLVLARLVTHWWAWNAEDCAAIVSRVPERAAIPTTLVHGRRDVSSPMDVPWRLARATGARLIVLDEGHGGPALPEAITDAVAASGLPSGD